MNNLKEYILEKFKISKDIKDIVEDKSEIACISTYLDGMIITKEEKYIIDEIVKTIEDWEEKNKVSKVACYMKESDFDNYFVKKQKEKITYDKFFLPISDDDYTNIYNSLIKSEPYNLYTKKMKNQMVNITIMANDEILAYSDNFLKSPIFISTKIIL